MCSRNYLHRLLVMYFQRYQGCLFHSICQQRTWNTINDCMYIYILHTWYIMSTRPPNHSRACIYFYQPVLNNQTKSSHLCELTEGEHFLSGLPVKSDWTNQWFLRGCASGHTKMALWKFFSWYLFIYDLELLCVCTYYKAQTRKQLTRSSWNIPMQCLNGSL